MIDLKDLTFNYFYYIEFSKKFMRLTKRDIALTRIDVPKTVKSIYFRGKRYSYGEYHKIKNKIIKEPI